MTVDELIAVLQAIPEDERALPVWHDGGGDPYLAGEITAVRLEPPEGMRLLGHDDQPERWVSLG